MRTDIDNQTVGQCYDHKAMSTAVWPPIPHHELVKEEEATLVRYPRSIENTLTKPNPTTRHVSSNGYSAVCKRPWPLSRADLRNASLCWRPRSLALPSSFRQSDPRVSKASLLESELELSREYVPFTNNLALFRAILILGDYLHWTLLEYLEISRFAEFPTSFNYT